MIFCRKMNPTTCTSPRHLAAHITSIEIAIWFLPAWPSQKGQKGSGYCTKKRQNPYIFTESQIGCATVPSPVALICWLSGWREPQWPSSPTPSSKRSLVYAQCIRYMFFYIYCRQCRLYIYLYDTGCLHRNDLQHPEHWTHQVILFANPRLHGWNWPRVVDGWVAFQEAGIGSGCFLHSKLWEPSARAEQRAKNGVVDIPEFENVVNVVSDSVIRSD